MREKGTVIDIDRGRAVVMTEQCRFVEIKAPGNMGPGDQIEFTADQIIDKRRHPFKALALAASVIIFLAAGWAVLTQALTSSVYAYISLDINPSLELAIDSRYKVVSSKGYNADGRNLTKKINLNGNSLDESFNRLLRFCRDNNYLDEDSRGQIAVSLYIKGDDGGEELQETLYGIIKKELAGYNIDSEIYCFNIDESTRKKALESNVSPSVYLLWSESVKKGYPLALGELSLKDARIRGLASEISVWPVVAESAGYPVKPLPGGNTSSDQKEYGLEKNMGKQGELKKGVAGGAVAPAGERAFKGDKDREQAIQEGSGSESRPANTGPSSGAGSAEPEAGVTDPQGNLAGPGKNEPIDGVQGIEEIPGTPGPKTPVQGSGAPSGGTGGAGPVSGGGGSSTGGSVTGGSSGGSGGGSGGGR